MEMVLLASHIIISVIYFFLLNRKCVIKIKIKHVEESVFEYYFHPVNRRKRYRNCFFSCSQPSRSLFELPPSCDKRIRIGR